MARKVKFALEMADGTKVRNSIEELREHFDMQSIVSYYVSGKLLEWLEDRYYDDEAAKIEELDKDSPNLNAQLCAIIGVDASEFDALDVEAVERLNEKKSILRQKTSDSTIIDNAMTTALNQEDLADLLDLESPVIYLCGEKFNVPIRVEHKKYIGILGTPKIEIRATSDDDLKAKDILFENVTLPWSNVITSANTMAPKNTNDTQSALSQELFELWNSAASARRKQYRDIAGIDAVWEIIEDNGQPANTNEFSSAKIKIALRTVCDNKYTENDIAKALIAEDFSSACIFTTDAVCFYDKNKMAQKSIKEITDYSGITNLIVYYKDIESVNALGEALDIYTKENNIITPFADKSPIGDFGWCMSLGLMRDHYGADAPTLNSVWKLAPAICNFLNTVKNL